MSAVAKLTENGALLFDCPGCGHLHAPIVHVVGSYKGPTWQWNNNFEKPTLSPSVKVTWSNPREYTCHFFVREGRIEFCHDCTHDSAGQTLDMVLIDG